MYLQRLDLEGFRSYRELHLSLDSHGLRLFGANGSGKSSLLEAIAMLATTRSPRSTADRQLINWHSGERYAVPAFARIEGHIVRAGGDLALSISLEADPQRPGLVRKQIRLRGRPVRAMDAVGTLRVVLFSPEDVALVSGPPSERRRYLDLTISQLDSGYLRALARYGRVLEQRNSLLKALARHRVTAGSEPVTGQLAFWNEELVAFGSAVIARRLVVTRRLAALAEQRFEALTGQTDLQFVYLPSLRLAANGSSLADRSPDAIQATIAREFAGRLSELRPDEVRRGVSLVGPHRDDAIWLLNGVELSSYGSRGQQRLAVVALKLAEADLMAELGDEPPLVLLDDILSELDQNHQSLLPAAVALLGSQVIITATDERLLAHPALDHLPLARVADGVITSG